MEMSHYKEITHSAFGENGESQVRKCLSASRFHITGAGVGCPGKHRQDPPSFALPPKNGYLVDKRIKRP
jgi:hypothetical protein